MKPGPLDYLAYREAAQDQERLAALTGLDEHLALARRLWAIATEKRLAALYPPQRCVECAATIHSDQLMCGSCGRARQGVKVNVEALARFFQGYDFSVAERVERNAARRRSGKCRGRFGAEGRATDWADKLKIDPSTLLSRAKRLGSLRAAVEHYSPGAWQEKTCKYSRP